MKLPNVVPGDKTVFGATVIAVGEAPLYGISVVMWMSHAGQNRKEYGVHGVSRANDGTNVYSGGSYFSAYVPEDNEEMFRIAYREWDARVRRARPPLTGAKG
jgi:hypothetical protein